MPGGDWLVRVVPTPDPDALTPYTARKNAEPNKAKREDVK